MSLAISFHFLRTQYASDNNISIIRSLRLCCWITTSVVLFSVRCVFEIWCGWVWVVSVLQAEACNTDTIQTQPHQISNTTLQHGHYSNPAAPNLQHKPATRTLLKPSRTKSPYPCCRLVLEIWCGWVWVVSVLQTCVGDLVQLGLSSVRVADLCWRFGAAGFEWCPCCRLVLKIWCGWVWVVSVLQACVGDLVRLGLSGVRVADLCWRFGAAGFE